MHFDVASAGVVYGSRDDQYQGLQDAIDFAAKRENGSLQISGIVKSARPLENKSNVPIYGLGSGDNWRVSPSALLFDVDSAEPKQPAIAFAKSWRPPIVKGITLAGPGWGSPAPVGDMPANMYGLGLPCRCLIEDVRIHGFGAAVGASNDHHRYRDVDFRGNGYAIDFIDNPDGGLGDMLFDGFLFNDQSRAGIAISSSNALVNARFQGNGHFGASPFAIYRYKGGGRERGTAMAGVVFENTSFEYCGSGLFYDEPGTGSWSNIEFNSPGEWGTFSAAPWPGKPTNLGAIDVGTVDGIHWTCGTVGGLERPAIRARLIRNVTVDKFDVNNILDFGWKPFVIRSSYNEWGEECDGITLGSFGRFAGGILASARVAHEPIAKGELVEMTAYSHVRRSRNNATSMIVGVSVDKYARGEVCLFASQFDTYALGVINTSAETIPQGALIEPDPATPGGVRRTAVRPGSIGRINDAPIPPGKFGRAQVSL